MMKWLKRILFFLLILLTIASIGLIATGNTHLFKGIANTYLIGRTGPSILEHEIFENRTVQTSIPQPWAQSTQYNRFSIPENFLDEMEKYNPVSFLIVQRDSIVLEKYWGDHTKNTLSNSFSMAKTFIGILTCMALDEGILASVDQKVGDFIPSFKEGRKSELTIRHLLSMSSGLNFDESYGDPFGFMAKAYYGDELEKKTLSYDATKDPGASFKYLGGNTILLSLILREATGMSVSEYCSKKLWKPIGAEQEALWNLDGEEGIEKAYCCFYSTARDFARVGQLFLKNGNWKGQQLLSEEYVSAATQPLEHSEESVPFYGWHWWVGEYKAGKFFYARGILGQYIIIIPELEMVVVRLGHLRSKEKLGEHIKDVFFYQDLAIELDRLLNS